MPLPKISGLLSNCALNTALPILLGGIYKLAEREAAGTLANLADNSIYKQYKQLKELFACYYHIDNNPAFNWREFYLFLNKHSFYANEIMFAPVFRAFIAEQGRASGSYAEADLPLLCDVQYDGRYNYLPESEAFALFHNLFGISIDIYEYVRNSHTDNPKDNYNYVSTRRSNYPYIFGEAPCMGLYLKREHFEIQPHESLAEAVTEFNVEINNLPEALVNIHHGLNTSVSADQSNQHLGKLVVYGYQALMTQLATAVQRVPAEGGVELADIEVTNNEDTKNCQAYQMSAQDYAIRGALFHNDTPMGRQTFAVILLTILLANGNDIQAKKLLGHLSNLSVGAKGDEPLASYLLDKLAIAIINSNADLNARSITETLQDIELNDLANEKMNCILKSKQPLPHIRLVTEAKETIKQAWQLYNKTGDTHLITIIQKTQALVIEPNLQNTQEYHVLQKYVDGKGSWGKIIAGLMLSVLGFALIVGASLSLIGSVGSAVPLFVGGVGAGVCALTLGIGFFSSGRDTGLFKDMQQVSECAGRLISN